MDKIEAKLFVDMALGLLHLMGGKPQRLQAALQRTEECAARRGIPVEDWLADAIESKNELEAGSLVDERVQRD